MSTMEHTAKKGYVETIGRRKTSGARVRMTEAAKNSITVNDKDVNEYFKTDNLRKIATEALATSKTPGKFKITVKVVGGGTNSQAEAVRLGISRALIIDDKLLRGTLKKVGFLKRDPRAKERRKFGLKKARKAPQWSKR
jgi:small subunit ribosomal protein S9